jgi:uncharacterized protein CbrC (UPF0167 family)
MKTGNMLPIQVRRNLEQLKRSAETYNDCLAIIGSTLKDIDSVEFDQVQRIISRLDGYFSKEWELANDGHLSFLRQSEDRQFRYVADNVLDDIFHSKKEAKCSVCNEDKLRTISHWVSPDNLTICDDCVSDGCVRRRIFCCDIRFHPFNSNPAASANQEYILSQCTPPIGSFCTSHDEYRWARHCGDYAVYQGDVLATDIPDDILKELVDNEGMEGDGFLDSYDPESPYCNDSFHKFECLTCKKTLYTYDYTF